MQGAKYDVHTTMPISARVGRSMSEVIDYWETAFERPAWRVGQRVVGRDEHACRTVIMRGWNWWLMCGGIV